MNKNERITFHKEQQIFALAARQSLAAKKQKKGVGDEMAEDKRFH